MQLEVNLNFFASLKNKKGSNTNSELSLLLGHNNPGFNMGIVATPPPNTHGKREDGKDDEDVKLEVLGEE
jgi:hypothetical protein